MLTKAGGWKGLLNKYSLVLILIVMMAVCSLANESF